jgi:acetyltransferase-like isoleucine patch superfamily enzyme
LVKRGAWIDTFAIMLPGVMIGENAFIGAITNVTKSVLPQTLFSGNSGRKN